MSEINCQVQSITPLTDHVYKVLLKPATPIKFAAGQYLNFVMSDDDKRPFSIASAPEAEEIELQIGAYAADSYPMQVIERIKAADEVQIEAPFGSAQLRDSERPLLLLAGGTGFSYIKSMFEHLANIGTNRKVIVYWGLRDESACYELEKTAATIAKLNNGQFNVVVEQASENWQGKSGLVHQVAMAEVSELQNYDIYLAGRFEMVGAVRKDFIGQGALVEHMYADAFAFI